MKMRRRRYHDSLNANYRNAKKMMCASSGAKKWLFHSRGAAIDAARVYLDGDDFRYKTEEKVARAYYCKACGGWHLTKMNLRQWNERKREMRRLRGKKRRPDRRTLN